MQKRKILRPEIKSLLLQNLWLRNDLNDKRLTRTWWCLAWPRSAASVPSSQARSWHKRLSLAGWHWGFRFETRWDRPTPQGLEHTDHCEYSCLQSGGCCAAITSYNQCLVCWNWRLTRQQMYVKSNNEVGSCNHCYSGEAISIT